VSNLDDIAMAEELADIVHVTWSQTAGDELTIRITLEGDRFYGWKLGFDNGIWTLDTRLDSRMRNLRKTDRVIVLDPGHGGDEWGAVGPGGTMEKDINLQLALKVQRLLVRKGYHVQLTRRQDIKVPLHERPLLAESADGDLFISLHFNAVGQGSNPWISEQTSTYFYTPQSQRAALLLHRNVLDAVQMGDNGFYYRNLAVLRQNWMPAVLLESAYLIQPAMEHQLVHGQLLDTIAVGVASGVDDYFNTLTPWWHHWIH